MDSFSASALLVSEVRTVELKLSRKGRSIMQNFNLFFSVVFTEVAPVISFTKLVCFFKENSIKGNSGSMGKGR